jgi:hypothetical protein
MNLTEQPIAVFGQPITIRDISTFPDRFSRWLPVLLHST